jgi:predicted signal transduction protein with EAL and GGDEF domain
VIADKFLESLHRPFDLDGHEVHISASIGIAIYPGDGESIDELLRHADIAMYQVKALGKNGHSFYHDSMLDVSHQKIALEQRCAARSNTTSWKCTTSRRSIRAAAASSAPRR